MHQYENNIGSKTLHNSKVKIILLHKITISVFEKLINELWNILLCCVNDALE